MSSSLSRKSLTPPQSIDFWRVYGITTNHTVALAIDSSSLCDLKTTLGLWLHRINLSPRPRPHLLFVTQALGSFVKTLACSRRTTRDIRHVRTRNVRVQLFVFVRPALMLGGPPQRRRLPPRVPGKVSTQRTLCLDGR